MNDTELEGLLDYMRQMLEGTGGYYALSMLASLLGIGARVFLCLAIDRDAKILGVKNKTVWIVLTALFPICAVIYLCVRNSLQKTVPCFCPVCGATSPPNSRYCVYCHAGNPVGYKHTDSEALERKRKVFVTIAIVLTVFSIGISRYASYKITAIMKENIERYQHSRNEYNLPYYNDPFSFYSDGDSDSSDSSDDSDDAFDDFNNFGN